MRSRIFVFAVLTLTAAPTVARTSLQAVRSRPPIPYQNAGACPFEGCTYGKWQANDTAGVRRTRSDKGGGAVTTSPGRVRFREPIDLSSGSGFVHVDPTDNLYLLTYGGEGFTKASFKGKLYERFRRQHSVLQCAL